MVELNTRLAPWMKIKNDATSKFDEQIVRSSRLFRPGPSLFLLIGSLLAVGFAGCANRCCQPCMCAVDSTPVIRGQSPDEVDPAFLAAPRTARPVPQTERPAPPVSQPPMSQPPMSQPQPESSRTADARNPWSSEPSDVTDEILSPSFSASTLDRPRDSDILRPDPNEPLADVRFEGNATIPVAAMSRYIKSRPGRPATVDQVRDDVRALYNTKWFFSIAPVYRAEAEGLVLVFKVTERPILRNVEYRGNESIKDNVLAGITGLKPMHAFSVATNREAARRIEQHYHDDGYMFAEVNLVEGADPQDRSVVFEINEGPKVKVKTVRFDGNEDVSTEVLKLQLSTKKRILWYFGGKYDPATISEDIAALKRYYHNIGYFDVVIKEKTEFSDDKSLVTIIYDVAEGPRYKIRDVRFEGNKIFSNEQLAGGFDVKSGDFFSARLLAEDVDEIKAQYGELGRLFAQVNASPIFTQETGVVDLVMNIDEDRVYRIGRISVNIRGDHTHTKETVALNHLLIAPGELADPEKIRRSKARLAGAAIWESGGPQGPEINLRPVDNPTYLTRSPTAPSEIVRASDSYFGDEKPLMLENTNLPEDIKRAARTKEFIPTVMRTERTPQAGSTPAPRSIPGAGHTLQGTGAPMHQAAPTGYAPAASEPAGRASVPSVPASRTEVRYMREERKPRQDNSEPLLYQPIDLNQTKVFHDGPEAFRPPPIASESQVVVRGQNWDNYNNPPNPMYGETPQGDLMGPQLPSPAIPPGYDPTIPPGFVDLDVNVTEARTGRFMVGAGVNSDSGVVGNIVLEEQNFDIMAFPRSFRDVADGYAFRGGGQQFRMEATPGSEVSRYLASWTDPSFLNTDYSLGVSGFYYQRFFRDWDEQRTGGRLNVGKLLSRELSFNTALRLESVNISDPRLPAGQAPSVDAMLGDNFLGTGRFTLAYDTRDSSYMATEGFNVSGSVEQAFADYDFTKLELLGSQYYTVYQRPDGAGKHILSFRGNLGWTTDDTPSFERFYAGGFQTFRGFEFRSVSPLEPGNLGTNGAAVGGFFQALGTAEYMVPVLANEAVRVVAFTDFGTVDEDVSLDKFRVSVGAGLRITVPQMGPVPIALDWAFPVVKQETDIRQIFSFYIGLTR